LKAGKEATPNKNEHENSDDLDAFTMTVSGVKLGFAGSTLEGKTISLRQTDGENLTIVRKTSQRNRR
jgi:hypothetical protein